MPRKTKKMVAGAVAHWRLAAGVATGLVVWSAAKYLGAPRGAHLLLGWDSGAIVYLLTMWTLFLTADEAEVRSRAAREDEGVPVLMLIIMAAIVASLGAVVDAMMAVKNAGAATKFFIGACAGATLVLSWLVLQSVFVLHYAHRNFGDGSTKQGIQFPGEPPTCYMDFAYLAFSVGATFQVSDNSILTSKLRKLVTAHAATAYFYNTAILALGINIIASLVGG
ncbi:DUF1345 domain-containing protein [uncultured Caulobacter sp.]|uniref:DUF1345 domain-containing protein n=1 Tax=uncultured Caulobacter sp. TaxID=158749 RepID=UPI0026145296|nr:DUF1345 domain-containing protein [uncultured Caulobacter sp.]